MTLGPGRRTTWPGNSASVREASEDPNRHTLWPGTSIFVTGIGVPPCSRLNSTPDCLALPVAEDAVDVGTNSAELSDVLFKGRSMVEDAGKA